MFIIPKIAKQYTPLAIVSLETLYEPDSSSSEDQCPTFYHTNTNFNFNSSDERLFKVVNAMGHTLECTSVVLTVSFKEREGIRSGLHQYSIVKSNDQWFLVDDNNTSRTTLNIGLRPWESTTFLAYLRADIEESSNLASEAGQDSQPKAANYQVVFGLIFCTISSS